MREAFAPTNDSQPLVTIILGDGETSPKPTEAVKFQAMPALPGYEFLGEIGRGAMGVVYRARQIALDRQVAIKALNVGMDSDPARLTRFEQEARSIARLRHPNIVTAFDLISQDGFVFLVMELFEEQDLGKRIAASGPLDENITWELVKQAAAGLAHAAEAGIVHRDIKPANMILVTVSSGGAPLLKIMDFGLALMAVDSMAAVVTSPGAIVGTPAYMAPEQFAGSHVDWRADLYALAASAVFMLTGQHPYGSSLTIWDILHRKNAGEMPLPQTLSAGTTQILRRMLARNPADRFQSYQELIAEIDRRRTTPTGKTASRQSLASLPANAKTRWWIGAICVLLILGALAGGIAIWRATRPSPDVPTMDSGASTALFNGTNLLGWQVINGTWRPAVDAEGGTVLAGEGAIRRPLPGLPLYRLNLGLDLRTASAVEVHFGIRANDHRGVLRITKESVVLGTQSGEHGDLVDVAKKIPSLRTGDAVPYREVKILRGPGEWYGYYDGKIIGRLPAHGDELPEFRIRCDGGQAYFESIEVIELFLTK